MNKLIAIGCLFVLASSTIMCTGSSTRDTDTADSIAVADTIETKRLTLLFAGDLMQHESQIAKAYASGRYDYTECFAFIKPDIEAADLAIANFETTLAGPPYAGFPKFSAPDAFLVGAKEAGFDIMLCANNHACDTGRAGLERTIMMMDSLNMPHLGSYVDEDARREQYPLIIERNGIKLALLNYTYGTNGLPIPKPNVVNRINKDVMAQDIKDAKALHPDCIIAFIHWGEEYELKQNRHQEELAQWLLDQGVDHVVGNHPHVVQPLEMRTDSIGQKHLVCYSLGNIVSNMTKPNTVGGIYISMTLDKQGDNRPTVSDASYSLFWVSRPVFSGHKQHRIYPISYPDSLLNKTEKAVRQTFVDNAREVFKSNKDIGENLYPNNQK